MYIPILKGKFVAIRKEAICGKLRNLTSANGHTGKHEAIGNAVEIVKMAKNL